MVDKVHENFVRRQAARLGYFLQKSKGKKWSVDNKLGYRLLDSSGNVVRGERFDLNLQDIENILREEEARLR